MTEKRQSIFRANHSKLNPYFQMLRTTAQDSTLSFEARGVIAYLLSQNEKWEINKSDLMNRGGIGNTKMNRIVSELIELRYLERTQENVKGKFEKVIYTLYEEPQVENAIADASPGPLSRKPRAGKPQAGNARQDTIKVKEDKTEEKDHAGAEKAPDAAKFPEGTIGLDGMMAELDITQADLDATPLDEITPEPAPGFDFHPTPEQIAVIDEQSEAMGLYLAGLDVTPDEITPSAIPVADAVGVDPVGEYVADMAAPAYDPPKTKRKPKPKTPHNLMFEAICFAFGYDWNAITKSKRGQVNSASKELLAVGVTPDDIAMLYVYCKRKFEQFGPVALATNWDDYKAERVKEATPTADPVKFIHDPACTACNYGMVIDADGKSIQCPQCVKEKEIA